jgi:hypothetical protein
MITIHHFPGGPDAMITPLNAQEMQSMKCLNCLQPEGCSADSFLGPISSLGVYYILLPGGRDYNRVWCYKLYVFIWNRAPHDWYLNSNGFSSSIPEGPFGRYTPSSDPSQPGKRSQHERDLMILHAATSPPTAHSACRLLHSLSVTVTDWRFFNSEKIYFVIDHHTNSTLEIHSLSQFYWHSPFSSQKRFFKHQVTNCEWNVHWGPSQFGSISKCSQERQL